MILNYIMMIISFIPPDRGSSCTPIAHVSGLDPSLEPSGFFDHHSSTYKSRQQQGYNRHSSTDWKLRLDEEHQRGAIYQVVLMVVKITFQFSSFLVCVCER